MSTIPMYMLDDLQLFVMKDEYQYVGYVGIKRLDDPSGFPCRIIGHNDGYRAYSGLPVQPLLRRDSNDQGFRS